MSVKMECDNCHAQVSNEGMANHGWIILSQQLMFNSYAEVPIQGSFCTVSCTVEWLQTKQEKAVVIEGTTQEETRIKATKLRDGAKDSSETVKGIGIAEEHEATVRGMTIGQFTGKAGQILRKVVGTDEPIAIFRARDLLSIFPLAEYAKMLERYGAHYDQQESWSMVRDEFRYWQNAHASQVRLPD